MQKPMTANDFDMFAAKEYLLRETKIEQVSVGLGTVGGALVVIVRYHNGYEERKTWVNAKTYNGEKMAKLMRDDLQNTRRGRPEDEEVREEEAAKGRERRQERGPRGQAV